MTEIVEKEQMEHNRQIGETETQLNLIEEEIRGLQSKLQDQIHQFQVLLTRQSKEKIRDKLVFLTQNYKEEKRKSM